VLLPADDFAYKVRDGNLEKALHCLRVMSVKRYISCKQVKSLVDLFSKEAHVAEVSRTKANESKPK
jgi:hypothetical protein